MMKINSGRWDEVNCELKKYFLCSKPPTSKMQKVDTFFTGSCIDEQSKKIPKTPGKDSKVFCKKVLFQLNFVYSSYH